MPCTPVNIFLPQVTRIPIAGPAPYNTLVSVAFYTPNIVDISFGQLTTQQFSYPSPFKLQGFDPRTPPMFEHSTSAWLFGLGPAQDDLFQYAVNSILGAGFDPADGTFFANFELACILPEVPDQFCLPSGECDSYFGHQISSYVLVYEPPPASQSTGSTGQHHRTALVRPNSTRDSRTLS